MKPCFHLSYNPADLLYHYSYKIHPDSLYDFTLCDTTSYNHQYIVYHYARPLDDIKEYVYVGLDTETNQVSQTSSGFSLSIFFSHSVLPIFTQIHR